MVTKTEQLYKELLSKRVVSFDDIVEEARDILEEEVDRRYLHRKYVSRLVKKSKLHRVRKGLYVVLSPLEEPEDQVGDKLLIASHVRDEYYLGFHTALEYYGCAHSYYNEAYICVRTKDRFDSFKYKRFRFTPVFVKDVELGVEEKSYNGSVLRVSSRARTFVDCIDRVKYAGGWEECLKSLEDLGRVKFQSLVDLLHQYGKDILFRRVGYILELLKEHSPFYEHLSERVLNEIETKITDSPRYLIPGKKGTLHPRWNLFIPQDFPEKLRGV